MENIMTQMNDKTEKIRKIQNRIVVFSGKGGVGKSTISVNISYALSKMGFKVGLLDADITGPNIPKMIGIKKELVINDDNKLVPAERSGVKVISMGFMINDNNPVIWRGPLKTKAIMQFLSETEWGDIDTIVVDLPPGTGDEILTILQFLKPNYAIIVTTPQNVSVLDATRAIEMAKKFSIPYVGVIENMSGLICPKCGYEIDIFGKGGGKKMAEDNNVDFLGFCILDPDVRKMSDEGKIPVLDKESSKFSKSIVEITNNLKSKMR